MSLNLHDYANKFNHVMLFQNGVGPLCTPIKIISSYIAIPVQRV